MGCNLAKEGAGAKNKANTKKLNPIKSPCNSDDYCGPERLIASTAHCSAGHRLIASTAPYASSYTGATKLGVQPEPIAPVRTTKPDNTIKIFPRPTTSIGTGLQPGGSGTVQRIPKTSSQRFVFYHLSR